MVDMRKLKEIKNNAKKYIELAKLIYADSRTPRVSKILLWIAIAYALAPVDLIPDFIPVIGSLDDMIIVPVLLYIAIKTVPKNVYIENYVQVLRK
jgi:uncharacterized membrane protein YkvA (DUF1232 family)